MTERSFRLLIGLWLVVALLAALPIASYVLMAVLLFEGITNLRIPLVISRLRFGAPTSPNAPMADPAAINFEAERALRLIIVVLMSLSLFLAPGMLWWLPWFVAFALIGAGLSGICPMVSALRWVGMR